MSAHLPKTWYDMKTVDNIHNWPARHKPQLFPKMAWAKMATEYFRPKLKKLKQQSSPTRLDRSDDNGCLFVTVFCAKPSLELSWQDAQRPVTFYPPLPVTFYPSPVSSDARRLERPTLHETKYDLLIPIFQNQPSGWSLFISYVNTTCSPFFIRFNACLGYSIETLNWFGT